MLIPFLKMHGLGNDFVIVESRHLPGPLSADAVRRLADRRRGVGCDQLITLDAGEAGRADAFMRIFNADGTESGACGNATRCVAVVLMHRLGAEACGIETIAGVLTCRRGSDDQITVDMGPARLDWREIPLVEPHDTLRLSIGPDALGDGVAVNVGNPHCVFFVPDCAAVPLAALGPTLESHPLFPERANIEIAQVLASDRLRMRVWERGGGITQACGSGACAVLVAAVRRGLTDRSATVILDGGSLAITWRDDGHVLMTGPTVASFAGVFDFDLLMA